MKIQQSEETTTFISVLYNEDVLRKSTTHWNVFSRDKIDASPAGEKKQRSLRRVGLVEPLQVGIDPINTTSCAPTFSRQVPHCRIRVGAVYQKSYKVEFQPFTRSYSQLTFFNFL